MYFISVINVESSHLYQDCEQFFRECARVLKRGGYLCWIDLRYKTQARVKVIPQVNHCSKKAHINHFSIVYSFVGIQVDETRRQAMRAGFIEERWEDVTENVLQGIEHTAARYDEILLKVNKADRFRAKWWKKCTHLRHHSSFDFSQCRYVLLIVLQEHTLMQDS